MAIKAFGKYGGSSFSETLLPAISPRVPSRLPSRPTIWIVGGRFGISSDWIGGRCAPTQTTTPTTAIPAHSPSTAPQYNSREMPLRARVLDLRLPPARPLSGFRSRGESLSARAFGFEGLALGLSSATV